MFFRDPGVRIAEVVAPPALDIEQIDLVQCSVFRRIGTALGEKDELAILSATNSRVNTRKLGEYSRLKHGFLGDRPRPRIEPVTVMARGSAVIVNGIAAS